MTIQKPKHKKMGKKLQEHTKKLNITLQDLQDTICPSGVLLQFSFIFSSMWFIKYIIQLSCILIYTHK